VFCVARVSDRMLTVLVRVISASADDERKAASITLSFAWPGRGINDGSLRTTIFMFLMGLRWSMTGFERVDDLMQAEYHGE
jgi:hypothetical protein